MAPSADKSAKTLFFALDVGHLDAVDLHLEEQFHRGFDLGLGRVGSNAENHLFVLVGNVCALFRHHGGEQNLHQTLLIETGLLDSVLLGSGCAHASISSNLATAPLVISVLSKRSKLNGSACLGSITRIFGRLRADSIRFSSSLSVMISTFSMPISRTFWASNLVFGEFSAKSSTTASRPSRASCDRIAARPARNILRLTLWLKFSSGPFGNILPPPRHNGLDAIPARARPVPFWRHGLRVDLAMSLRPFCARVAMRALARCAVTT